MGIKPDDLMPEPMGDEGLKRLGTTEEDLAGTAITDEDWDRLRVTEEDLAAMAPTVDDLKAMSEADWKRIRLARKDLARLRDDLRRLGMTEQELAWLSRVIERKDHGHPRPQTHPD